MRQLSTLSTFCSQKLPYWEIYFSLNGKFHEPKRSFSSRQRSARPPISFRACTEQVRWKERGRRRRRTKTPSPTRYLAHPMHPKRPLPYSIQGCYSMFLTQWPSIHFYRLHHLQTLFNRKISRNWQESYAMQG